MCGANTFSKKNAVLHVFCHSLERVQKSFCIKVVSRSTHVIKLALFYNNITNIKTTKRKHFLEILPLQSDQNPPGHRYPHLRNTALEYVLPFGGENTMLNDSMRVHSH